MKKSIKGILLALVLSLGLVACGGNTSSSGSNDAATAEATESNELKFISSEDAKKAIEENPDDYILLDVRKKEDYDAGTVDGFVSADLDAAKEGDVADGVATLEKALEGTDEDDDILIMCYSGAGYAQTATDILINELGVDPDRVITVEGGMKEW